jgi:hypothetical protein
MAQARFGRPEPGERYALWAKRLILFHGKRHPRDLDEAMCRLAPARTMHEASRGLV